MIQVYRLIVCMFVLNTGGLFAASSQKPNFVFLFADDQRADTIRAHGNDFIHTPNLDRLAESGFSFKNNYCAGSYSGAVCVASRAMLMTGRYWNNIPNVKKNGWASLDLLPTYLKEKAGYETYIIGKWHNGLHTLRAAFQNGASVYMGGMADHTDFEVQDFVAGQLQAKRRAKEFSSTEFANSAIKYIEEAPSDKPFFLYVAFMAPHDPRNPPDEYRQRYYKNRPPLAKNYKALHPFRNVKFTTQGRDEGLASWPREKSVISDQLCEYYGLVTHLDEQVGRIIDAIDQSKHADNTIIIYTADHGLAMGSHGLLGKQNVYEHSMKAPLIISGKTVPNGESAAFNYIHDLYATLCDYARIAKPEAVDAKSLRPLIEGEIKQIHEAMFLPFQDVQFAINDGRWKLHIYPQIDHYLLFDLENDPDEIHSLEAPNKKAEMLKLMKAWQAKTGSQAPLVVANPEPKEVDYSKLEQRLDKWQPQWIQEKYFKDK
ncbi:sulfatase-like hydrolase/transferase [Lentisphaera araneosa]|nr:sulfatase-like hydrolase/transferase [Lentisphaera araneosa]